MVSSQIHRDLLAIIFAYARLSRRSTFSTVSRQLRSICALTSYHYIISLRKCDIHKVFKFAYTNNEAKLVAICLKSITLNPAQGNNQAIRWASDMGFPEIVKLLLADGDNENPLSFAAAFPKSRQRINPAAENNYAIRLASQSGHLEIVKLLLADLRVNPADVYDRSIRMASQNGHIEIVKLLMADPRVNPTVWDNTPIRLAYRNRYLDMVRLLFRDIRVYNTLSNGEKVLYQIYLG